MIQFACPGCATISTLGDEFAGKIGRCRKCQAQFTIPMPEAAPSPPPPPVDPPDPAGAVRCPTCRAKLAIDPAHLHAVVACPYCQTQFKLKPRDGDPPSNTVAPPILHPVEEEVEDVIPPSWGVEEAEEPEERPRRPSRRREDWDDEDDDDDRPRRKRPRRRSRGTGKTVPRIISGILSLLIGGMYLICGIGLAVAGSTIMGLIGAMGPQGDQPGGGRVQGLAGVGIGLFLCCGLLIVVFGGMYLAAGIGALNRKSWGRIWTIVAAVFSCLGALSEFADGAGAGLGRNASGAAFSFLQAVVFAGHAVASFMATLGQGAHREFNR